MLWAGDWSFDSISQEEFKAYWYKVEQIVSFDGVDNFEQMLLLDSKLRWRTWGADSCIVDPDNKLQRDGSEWSMLRVDIQTDGLLLPEVEEL